MTLQQIYTRYLAEREGNVKPATLATYRTLGEAHILPVLGEKEGIGMEEIALLRESVLTKGRSEKTAVFCCGMVKSMLNYGARRGWCPMPAWSVGGQAARPRRSSILTLEEHRKLLSYLTADRTHKNIGLYLAATTGITRAELCNLTWQDIDFKARALHVRGDAARSIPLASAQIRFLRPEKGRHLPELFVMSNADVPATVDAVRWYAKTVFKALGMAGHQIKDLRDTFAVRCLESGCDLSGLATLLGTSDYTNLMKAYGQYLRHDSRGDIERMMEGLVMNSPHQ